MKASYLIQLVEDFCKDNNLDITKIYTKMASIYQYTYGVNILMEMAEHNYYDVVYYLEYRDIVDRYVHILNGLKNMIKNNWDLELDNIK